MTKLLTGGTNDRTTASIELGSRLSGSHSIRGTIRTIMIGIISDCASRISLTAAPTAAISDANVKKAST